MCNYIKFVNPLLLNPNLLEIRKLIHCWSVVYQGMSQKVFLGASEINVMLKNCGLIILPLEIL